MRKRPVFPGGYGGGPLARNYDVLVVHKIDRFSRKLRITLEYFEKLGKAGVGFVSIENQIDYSTPAGKFMLVMQGGLAELYSYNLSLEVKKGKHEWTSRVPEECCIGLDAATQPQKNKLVRTLLEEIWVEDTKIVAVKPRSELEMFFKMNLECQSKY